MTDALELATGVRHALVDGLTIGRSPLVDVHLDDVSVSREHARVIGRPALWLLQDLHSRNGTWVNRRRLLTGGSHPVRDGDVVAIGNVVLTVRTDGYEEDPTTGLVASVLSERLDLSPYQRDVLRLLCSREEPEEPLSNAEIAAALGTPAAVDAVKAALSRIYARSGLSEAASPGKRRELRRRAVDHDWLR